MPAVATAGWLPSELLADGPFGVAGLSPVALGGLRLDPLLHGMLWSLGPNLALFVAVSLTTLPSAAERRQAERFVGMRAEAAEGPARAASLADLHELAARHVGRERADATFRELALARDGDESSLLARGDAEAVQVTERLLAGAVGSASARAVEGPAVRRRSRGVGRGRLRAAASGRHGAWRSRPTRCRAAGSSRSIPT